MDCHSCHVACYDLVQVDELKAKGETDAVIESTAEGFSTCRFFMDFLWAMGDIYLPTIVGFAETWVFWIFVG